MIAFSCPGCHKTLSVNEDLAGKACKCTGCGQVMRAPAHVALASSGNGTLEAGKAFAGPGLTDFLAPAQAGDELGRLGKYRVLKVLGHGGMGVVYLGEDTLLKRKVAIKAMLPAITANAGARQRFLREAQAMAQVKHDHVATIYQVDEERGLPFLAMEFLAGEPLDQRLKRDGRLSVPEVLRIGREMAEGLQAAHATGLIHRDIKPANIWLEAPKGRVKILDFGLARAVSPDAGEHQDVNPTSLGVGDASLTQQGSIVGTPAYMSPEQARGEPVDARTDLFGVGVVLYRLCTGRQPFKGKDMIATLLEVGTYHPQPPSQVHASIPQPCPTW
jgi:serine/threonine protein kinase